MSQHMADGSIADWSVVKKHLVETFNKWQGQDHNGHSNKPFMKLYTISATLVAFAFYVTSLLDQTTLVNLKQWKDIFAEIFHINCMTLI